jgi:hypothetical protein
VAEETSQFVELVKAQFVAAVSSAESSKSPASSPCLFASSSSSSSFSLSSSSAAKSASSLLRSARWVALSKSEVLKCQCPSIFAV